MNNDRNRSVSTSNRFACIVTFLLGLAFAVSLIQGAWKTEIERKQKDFYFEILSIQQAVADNVLSGNDVTNNVAAYMSSSDNILSSQFESFAVDILERYKHIEAINYYTFTGDHRVNEFRLLYALNRGTNGFNTSDDVYADAKYRYTIDTSIETAAVAPSPPDLESGPDRKYRLFKAVYSRDKGSLIKDKNYQGTVQGVVSVLVSSAKLPGEKGTGNLTVTVLSGTSDLYGRQLLYYNNPDKDKPDKTWKVETLVEEKLIQLPSYSIKIMIEKNLYFADLEYHFLFVSFLIGSGVLMMLYGLVRARIKQEEELRLRNAVIEQKVEEQTRELAIARDDALEAARIKSEFLASMSHEIRTPLNAIIGTSDLLSETKLDREQNRYVNVFKKAGDALLSLVNDILDLSKIEADQLVLEEIPFNVDELIEETAEIYALTAADKNIEIVTRIAPNINTGRIGDPGRLKQIILNLVGNAVKFTEQGEIVISLSAEHSDHNDNSVTISVTDTGIGIAGDKLDSIFTGFTQVDASTTRKYGGTGLGLTIAKRLTEMMGGKIRVESEANKGSCFLVELALAEQTQKPFFIKNLKHKNCLIADVHSKNCVSIAEQLTAFGASCTSVSALVELENVFESGLAFDLMLVDSRFIFNEDGLIPAFNDITDKNNIVVLVNPEYINKHSRLSEQYGFDKLLIKPVKRKELYREIDSIFNGDVHQRYDATVDTVATEEAPAKHILLVEDNPDNRMLIKACLKQTKHILDEAENGVMAVDLYKKNNYDLVLMDVQMPVMDGHEASRLIRKWELDNNKDRTTIIALTAHAIKEEIDKCMRAGCDKHLSKPLKKATLLQAIRELDPG